MCEFKCLDKTETCELFAARIAKSASLRAIILGACCAAAICLPAQLLAQNRQGRAARTASIHWDQVPLGEGLQRIAANYSAAILLDRRVDPTTRLTLDTQDADVIETVQQAAAAAGLGMTQVGTLYYVGPPQTTDGLRTLAALRGEEIARVPSGRAEVVVKRSLVWPRLVEPRALVANVVTQRGWQIVGGEKIPYDLWPAGSLPAMTLAEQLTVLLSGFELTFRVGPANKTIEILPIAEPLPLISRRYPLRYPAADAERLQQQFPNLRLQVQGDAAAVEARLEDHEELAEWLAGPQSRAAVRPPAAPGRQVYTLRVEEQPVRAVLNTLVQRLKWQVNFDETALNAAGLSLDKRVSFDVKDASQEELLRAVLRPAGLDFRREGERIEIVAGGE